MNLNTIGGLGTEAQNGAAQAPGKLVSSTQFLELLVAQIQNQNPLKPLEGTEFVTQLAEFAGLEQLSAVNQGLDAVNAGQAALLSQQTLGMLGQQVSYPGDSVELSSEGSTELSYRLDGTATDLTIVVTDESGTPLGEIRRASRQGGLNRHPWTGEVEGPDGPITLAPGRYRFEVNASDGGTAVGSETFSSGRVTGITYERGYPELMLENRRLSPADVIAVYP